MPYDILKEMDAITAADLNSKFTTLVQSVNTVPDDAIEEESLGHQHCSEGVIADDQYPAGVTYTQVFEPASPIAYRNLFPSHGAPTVYNDVLATAESLNGVGGAWTVIRDAQPGGNPLRAWFKQDISLGMSANGVAGILVLASIEVAWVGRKGSGSDAQAPTDPMEDESIYACVMFNDGGGTAATNWYAIPRSVRSLSSSIARWDVTSDSKGDSKTTDPDLTSPAQEKSKPWVYVHNFKSLDLATLIRFEDLDAYTDNIRGVQIGISAYDDVGVNAKFSVEIQRAQMTVLMLHAEDPA
jgi:hypothetical protein